MFFGYDLTFEFNIYDFSLREFQKIKFFADLRNMKTKEKAIQFFWRKPLCDKSIHYFSQRADLVFFCFSAILSFRRVKLHSIEGELITDSRLYI